MPLRNASKRSQSGQAIFMYTMMLVFVLIPMVGLAIDGTRGYLIRLKLSGAVDGGALAAARLMGTGTGSTAQMNSAATTGVQYVKANFPDGFFGASLAKGSGAPLACIDPGTTVKGSISTCGNTGTGISSYNVRIVSLSASAIMNSLFMGLIGMPTITVNATGVASRRDVRVVLVIDRSSSMGGYFGTSATSVIPMAEKFVNSFSGKDDFGGRDEMALVVFGGSGIVAYPPRDVSKDFTDRTQFVPPDTNFKNATTGIGTPTVSGRLDKITSGSNTGTAEGLYLAYMTLRADAATNTALPAKLNVIVLFTDGIPNGITAWANDPKQATAAGNKLDYMMPLKATSGCANIANGKGAVPASPAVLVSTANTNMIGWFAQGGGNATGNTSAPFGLYPNMMAYAYSQTFTGHTGTTNGHGDDIDLYLGDADSDKVNGPIPQWSGCNSYNPMAGVGLMKKFPTYDLYGNYIDLTSAPPPAIGALTMPKGPSNAALYKSGTLWSTKTQCNKATFDATNTDDACQVGLAAWQAAAHQAWKIWNNIVWDKSTQANILDPETNIPNPVIFTIGFQSTTTDPPDMNLLKLISNDPSSPVSFSSRVNGAAYSAADPAAVDKAFSDIESEILRLSQ